MGKGRLVGKFFLPWMRYFPEKQGKGQQRGINLNLLYIYIISSRSWTKPAVMYIHEFFLVFVFYKKGSLNVNEKVNKAEAVIIWVNHDKAIPACVADTHRLCVSFGFHIINILLVWCRRLELIWSYCSCHIGSKRTSLRSHDIWPALFALHCYYFYFRFWWTTCDVTYMPRSFNRKYETFSVKSVNAVNSKVINASNWNTKGPRVKVFMKIISILYTLSINEKVTILLISL